MPIDPPPRAPSADAVRVTLWSCSACGALGTADACIGACDDRRAGFVRAGAHAEVGAAAAAHRAEVSRLTGFVHRIADADLPPGAGERVWRTWQRDARALLSASPASGRVLAPAADDTVERITAWWCAACGRIEAPQPCLGVCTRRSQEFVRAEDHAPVAEGAAAARAEARRLLAAVTIVARTTPRDGRWDASARAVRERARAALTT